MRSERRSASSFFGPPNRTRLRLPQFIRDVAGSVSACDDKTMFSLARLLDALSPFLHMYYMADTHSEFRRVNHRRWHYLFCIRRRGATWCGGDDDAAAPMVVLCARNVDGVRRTLFNGVVETNWGVIVFQP